MNPMTPDDVPDNASGGGVARRCLGHRLAPLICGDATDRPWSPR